MYITIRKINKNIRFRDLLELLTFRNPIYKIKKDEESIMIMYSTISEIQLCLELDGVEFVDPLNINYVELLVPTKIRSRRKEASKCVCFISDNYMEIVELESKTSVVLLFVYQMIQGKHFFIVEFETPFDFTKSTGFYDVFTFEDYLDSLIYCNKV